MNRRHATLIARRELRERTRKPSYRLTTVLGLVLIGLLFVLPTISDKLDDATRKQVAVQATPAQVAALQRALPEKAPNGKPTLELERVASPAAAASKLDAGDVDGVLVVGAAGASYRADDVSGDTVARLKRAVSTLAVQERLAQRGLDAGAQRSVFAPAGLRLSDADGKDVSDDSRALVYALLLMLYLSILVYGAAASSAIVGEKASRVTEVMLSRVTPTEHLAGKLGGIGLAGLIQYVIWIGVGLAVLGIGRAAGADPGVDLADVPAGTLVAFGAFFVAGFALFGTIYAAFSAPASRVEDANAAGIVPGVLIVASFLAASVALDDPDSGAARVLSLIPPLSPMTMFTRVALGSPAWWEVLLSLALLAGAIALVLSLTARIYRVAILSYGTKPTPRAVLKLVRS